MVISAVVTVPVKVGEAKGAFKANAVFMSAVFAFKARPEVRSEVLALVARAVVTSAAFAFKARPEVRSELLALVARFLLHSVWDKRSYCSPKGYSLYSKHPLLNPRMS